MSDSKQVAPDSVSLDSTITSVELAALEKELAAHVDPKQFSEIFERFLTAESVLSIGKYHIQKVLGKSGQAVVFVAKDPDLRRLVALKLFHSGMSKEDKKLLLREGRALSKINSKRVVKCFAAEKFRDCPFLVLEYLPHPTLRNYFEDKKPLEEKQIIEILSKICLGIKEVHDIGLVHGDIKPSNVLVTRKSGSVDICLIDFGLSRYSGDFENDSMGGTPSFMSPECANHNPAGTDFYTDVFGVGAIAFFLMSGEAPFHGTTKTELIEKAKICDIDFSKIDSNQYSPELIDFCRRSLAKDPADRYENMSQCLRVLSRSGPLRWLRRKFIAAAIVLLVGLFISIFAWNKIYRPHTEFRNAYRTMLETEFGKSRLKNDFDLGFSIDGHQYYKRRIEPVILTSDKTIEIGVRPEVDCFVGIFSLHFTDDSDKKQLCVIYPPAGENGFVKGDHQRSHDVTTGTSKGTEYILICACAQKWDQHKFAHAFNSAEFKKDVMIFADYVRKVRDMRLLRDSRRMSELVIPYLSKPPE